MSVEGDEKNTLTRREFLHYSIFGFSSLIGASLLFPALTYFLSPAWKKEEEDWILIGAADKIPLGEPSKVEFLQRRKDGWMTVEEKLSAWVLTRDGKDFTVFNPRCTHLGCPYRWDGERKQFLCPCHTAVFDMDGKVISGPPPRPLDRLLTKVERGKLWVLPRKTEAAG